MKIELSKEEAKKLADMIFISDMIINGARQYEERIPEYDELKNKIYEAIHKDGDTDIIVYSDELKEYEMETNYSFEVYEFISEYEDQGFWEELPFKLAVRDVESNGVEYISTDDYRHDVMLKEEMYKKEFEKNGVERLKIDGKLITKKPKDNGGDAHCGCGCGHNH